MLSTPVLALGSLLLLAGLLYRWLSAKGKNVLTHLPVVKFDNDDTPQRYQAETGKLLRDAYYKHLKHGQAFQMRNPVDEARPQIILPLKYLDEVKSAPVDRLSFPLFSEQSFLLQYTGGPRQTDAATVAVRVHLTKNIGSLVDEMHEEGLAALNERLPEMKDWTGLRVYEIFAFVIARITNRIFVGPELSRNLEWTQLMIGITIDAHMAARTIRETYSPQWRWLTPWLHPGAKRVFGNRRKAAQVLLPYFERKIAARKTSGSEGAKADGIDWLLDALKKNRGSKTLEQLVDELAFISVASIHTSTATLTQLLYDLVCRPEYIPELIEEINNARGDEGRWTKQNIAKLRKLDSFMRESQRINPLGLVTIQRAAVQPYTFKDGLHIPANHQISMPSYELNHDPDVYPAPDQFDGYRFLKLREAGDPNKFHFASVSDDSINFGAGSHACPGRFFAGQEIKLIIAELLLTYEMKFADGQGRPENMVHDFAIIPNIGAEVFFKRKS